MIVTSVFCLIDTHPLFLVISWLFALKKKAAKLERPTWQTLRVAVGQYPMKN